MEIYKQKEYDVRNVIDSTLALSSTFEDYVENVKSYIDQLENVVKDYNIIKQENEKMKATIASVDKYLDENGNRYIYQDGLGEDWYFYDLDIFNELRELANTEEVENDK